MGNKVMLATGLLVAGGVVQARAQQVQPQPGRLTLQVHYGAAACLRYFVCRRINI